MRFASPKMHQVQNFPELCPAEELTALLQNRPPGPIAGGFGV